MRKSILMAATLGLALVVGASPLLAADEADITGIAEKIRAGKIDVGKKYSMNEKKGRLHIIHGGPVGLTCDACHFGETYQSDFLLVRKGEPVPKKGKGQVDRAVCIACHRKGGPATTFFGERPAK